MANLAKRQSVRKDTARESPSSSHVVPVHGHLTHRFRRRTAAPCHLCESLVTGALYWIRRQKTMPLPELRGDYLPGGVSARTGQVRVQSIPES